MSHTLSPEHLRRLAFIRYLHDLGQQQAEAPEPRSAVAVLMLHDAVELFLHLAAEKRGVGRTDRKFASYFDAMPDLQARGAMNRLNDARVSLKHSGIRPAHEDVAELRAAARIFLAENTAAVFGVEFAAVSMLDLVQHAEIRGALKIAQEQLAGGDQAASLIEISRAYRCLMREHSATSHGVRALGTADQDASSRSFRFGSAPGATPAIARLAEQALRPPEVFVDAVTALLLRLDLEQFFRFKSLISPVQWSMADTAQIVFMSGQTLETRDLEFGIAFVTEAALRLGSVGEADGELAKSQ